MNAPMIRALAALVLIGLAHPPGADTATYDLRNHPDGNAAPPLYGLRLDDLIDDAVYTFDFEYDDGSEVADVNLDFDGNTIHIYGRAYGGKDVGTGYDAHQQGWVDINYYYTVNIVQQDGCAGPSGGDDLDDLYVIAASPLNAGTITLDGWCHDKVYSLIDKYSTVEGNTFSFDNDCDPRDPIAEADPLIVSGSGWMDIPGVPMNGGARDWLFLGEEQAPVSVEGDSWGAVKAGYR